MSRIYGQVTDINHDKIKDFFEQRFDKDHPLASVMLRQAGDHIAEQRNQNEKKLLDTLLEKDGDALKVLDIGCGMGRWVNNLHNRIALYDGIDFAQNYVDAANQLFQADAHVHFYQGLASEADQLPLQADAYDLIIVNGLMVYMNDGDVVILMKKINHLLKAGGKLYIRESISVLDQRLTLKDFHSDELNADYNAIYRTAIQYETIFHDHLARLRLCSSGLMLDKTLGAREETNQRYWFFECH